MNGLTSNSGKNDHCVVLKVFNPYSNGGRDMLVNTKQGRIYVVDSIECQLKLPAPLTGHKNDSQLHLEASFTPDGNYIIGGTFGI
jgi:hypothetical protein